MLKRLLIAAALALLVPLTGSATDVVCSATPESTGATCSETTDSGSVQLQCVCSVTPTPTPTPTPSPLDGFFTSFWKLDDLTDAIGSNTLTNSGMTFAAGKIGNAAVGTGTTTLTRASVAFTGPSLTVVAWFKTNNAAQQYHLNWNGVASPCIGLTIGYSTAGVGKVTFYTDAGAAKFVTTTAATYADGAYHLVIAYHDGASHVNTLIVDNGTPTTTAATADITSASALLAIGSFGGSSVFWANGQQLDAIGIADNKIPTAAQITALWNSGTGVEPPF